MLIRRTLVVGSFVTSIGVYSNLIPAYPLVFLPYKIFAFPPQIWRLVTAFFITGPRTGIIFDPYFLYQYGSQLELSSSRFTEPGSFLTYIAFNGLVISVSPCLGYARIAPFDATFFVNLEYLPAQSL